MLNFAEEGIREWKFIIPSVPIGIYFKLIPLELMILYYSLISLILNIIRETKCNNVKKRMNYFPSIDGLDGVINKTKFYIVKFQTRQLIIFHILRKAFCSLKFFPTNKFLDIYHHLKLYSHVIQCKVKSTIFIRY